FLPITHTDYKKQLSFDKRLAKLVGIEMDKEVQLTSHEFLSLLIQNNKQISGHSLTSLNYHTK
ncbi:hypothetical protein EAY27_26835, partial [Vibrio anguillarum]